MIHDELQISRPPGLWPPSWPMGLTMLRLLLLPVFLFVLLSDAGDGIEHRHRYRWLAVAIFAVMAITDKLDGYLARKFKQSSKLGAMLDPVADKLVIACSVILLSFPWVAAPGFRIPVYVVAIVYGKDLFVAAGSLLILSILGKLRVSARPLGKLGTFLQLSMVIATLIGPDLERLSPPLAWWMIRTLWIAVAVVTAAAAVDYLVLGLRQLNEEKKGMESKV